MTNATEARQQALEENKIFWEQKLDQLADIIGGYVARGHKQIQFNLWKGCVRIERRHKFLFFYESIVHRVGWLNDLIDGFQALGYTAKVEHINCEQGYLHSCLTVSLPGAPAEQFPKEAFDFWNNPRTGEKVGFEKE